MRGGKRRRSESQARVKSGGERERGRRLSGGVLFVWVNSGVAKSGSTSVFKR